MFKPLLKYAVCVLLAALLPAACTDASRRDAGEYGYEVRGIDLSSHNGAVDFAKVRDAGFEFVILKATEGGDFKDRAFADNLRRARLAGLKTGAYHFFRFDTEGYIQGVNFLNSLQAQQIDLPIVVDIEEWANSVSQPTPLVINRLQEMIDYLEAHGRTVMIYTNKNGLSRFVKGRYEGHPLWICSLGQEPVDVAWTFWQTTHHGSIPGVDHPVDINVFRGSRADWETFLNVSGPDTDKSGAPIQ